MNFLNEWALYERLRDCYAEHGALIIAYDIDDTVRPFRSEDKPCREVRNLLRQAKKVLNAQFIVFTANKDIEGVKQYLRDTGLPWDFLNENTTLAPASHFNSNKIYYNILLDDKAGLATAYKCLKRFVEESS